MALTFTIPVLQFGSTAWYRVQTPDFFLFDLTLIKEYALQHRVPHAFTIVDDQSTCTDKEVVRQALKAIRQWMRDNIGIYEVE